MANLANDARRGKAATRQAENLNIILGPHRIRGCTLKEAAAMAANGSGYIRETNALRLICSEAYFSAASEARERGKRL